MKRLYRSFLGAGFIVALLCGLNGCMSQELKTALSNEDAQAVSQLVQNDPDDFLGASLKDYTLRGLELRDLTIKNVDIYNLALQGARLTNVTLEDCTLTGVDFSNNRFSNVRFIDCTLSYMGNSGYNFKPTIFNNSLFDRVSFGQGSILEHVSCEGLILGSSLSIVGCTLRTPMSEEDATLL